MNEHETREFYLWATRPRNRTARAWERAKFPVTQRVLRNRNLGFQDGRILEQTRFDAPERFSEFDVETIGWRRLAILSARYGGRHDRIPADVVARLNGTAAQEDDAGPEGNGSAPRETTVTGGDSRGSPDSSVIESSGAASP
jgi:hypothetical protein